MFLTQNKICKTICVVAALVAMGLELTPVVVSAAGAKRVVNFPKDFSIGILTARKAKRGPDYKTPIGPAQGTITFDAGSDVLLDANHKFFLHPEVLKNLPPDCLESLRMRFSSFDDSEDGLCDKAMIYVGRMTGLKNLILDRSEVSDIGLTNVKYLTNLESLSLFSTLVNGSSFKSLTNLKKLSILKMANNSLKPASYAYLVSLPKLERLNLTRCHPNGEALKHVGECTSINELHLGRNENITDETIKYIAPLKKLHFLDVVGTRVTERGLAALNGLPIKQLRVPVSLGHPQVATIKKLFPGAKVIVGHGAKSLGEDAAIFEPMH